MRSFAALVLTSALLAGCPKADKPPAPAPRAEAKPDPGPTAEELLEGVDLSKLHGLMLVLSEAEEGASQRQVTPPAKGERLDAARVLEILKRLPAISKKASDIKGFAFRDRSLKPPLTGDTVEGAFPPPIKPPAPDKKAAEPLEVSRFQPEGEVPIAPNVSVTFSQPMVPVTSQDDAAATIPVKLSPQPPGQWRWIGTRTVLFEPKPRFPMATEYTVEIPAGTTSELGGKLAKAKTFTFATPPPQVRRFWPQSYGQVLDVPMFVEFDQAIDPDTVLPVIEVDAGKGKLPLQLMTVAEAKAHESLSDMVERAEPGRWLAFRTVRPLPKDARVRVAIGPGVTSREGPRKTKKARSYRFRTYAPLAVERHYCSWRGKCPPGAAMSIRFNNALDPEFEASMLRVDPPVEGMKVDFSGSWLHVRGHTKARTTYTVTLSPGIRDVYGQVLGAAKDLTFEYGDAPPFYTTQGGPTIVLEPTEDPSFPVYSVNIDKLKVALYRVEPKDFPAWEHYLYRFHANKKVPTPPGKRVLNRTMTIAGDQDQLVETPIKLAKALGKDLKGHVIVTIEPMKQPEQRWRYQRKHHWLQVTGLGVTAAVDHGEVVGWVSQLKDGSPVAGAELSLLGAAKKTTGDAGMVRLPLPPYKADGVASVLVASKDGDVALLPERTRSRSQKLERGGWYERSESKRLLWYVIDDRGMYKPKETVTLKGILRRMDPGEGGDVMPFDGAARRVEWKAYDPRRNEIAKGEVDVTPLGGFHLSFELPDAANLGWARVALKAKGGPSLSNRSHSHGFQVQEFRRPEYEVTATASEGPHLLKGHAVATVTASYYTGGGLPNADVDWTVTSRRGSFQPPDTKGWTFGTWTPWWMNQPSSGEKRKTFKGVTDGSGAHRLRVDFPAMKPPRPMVVRAQASVQDVNRQRWAATTTFLVHPAMHYVGVKTKKSFVPKGKPIEVDAIVVGLTGERVPERKIAMRAVRLEWRTVKGKWKQVEEDPQDCVVTSAATPQRCSFKTPEGGRYRVVAKIEDPKGRPNESELTVWVPGGKQRPNRNVKQQSVTLIPDQEKYAGGDTAQILVQSPFEDAEGLMTVRRSGIVKTERFQVKGTSHTLSVPLTSGDVPNVYVNVQLLGMAHRAGADGEIDEKLPKRPAYAAGQIRLPIPPEERTLSVAAAPREEKIEPRGETTVDVVIQDDAGKPVANTAVSVIVVDEAILALTRYQLKDPVGVFYTNRGDGASDYHLRQMVQLKNPESLANELKRAAERAERETRRRSARKKMMKKDMAFGGVGSGEGGGGRGVGLLAKAEPAPAPPAEEVAEVDEDRIADGEDAGAIGLRKDFEPLAAFEPEVVTDASGRVSVKVKVKDNLTRYRVMVVAADEGNRFGSGESAITARLPLMVRPSAPRFLNYGDRFQLPVVLQNQTDAPMTVEVAVRASNAKLTEGGGQRVKVPANDRIEVRFPTATDKAGRARFQIAAVSGKWSDAGEVDLPVWTPATTEAFATYGTIDEGAIRQSVKLPTKVVEEFGGLEVTTSSTAVQALTDAFLYLMSYPYECSEQLGSRILGVAALRDVLTAFEAAEMPSEAEIVAAVKRDIKKLVERQHWNGGFGFWRPGQTPWPYVSIYVTQALTLAKEKGFEVPERVHKKALGYLRNIERHFPWYYGPEIRRTLTAYALNVRLRNGDRDAKRARKLIAEAGGVDKLSLEAVGWIYPVLSGDSKSGDELAEVRRALNNRVTETAGAAHYAASYSDGAHLILHSSRRADGIILDGLITDQPKSDLIAKIVRGLLAHRKRGRWSNTQENAFVLMALDRYFNVYEKTTPDFVARVWLGEGYAGDHAFKGRTTERFNIDIPMPFVAKDGGEHDLVIQKDGAGRLYYRIGMNYAPASLKLDPADHGFVVRRAYEGVDDPGDARRDDEGRWHIKAGAKVRVRLSMVAPTRRYHVALVDPMPAGLEPMNPALAVTGDVPADPKAAKKQSSRWWWLSRPWFEHQNMRDERVEAFTSLLWGGVHEYTYVATATTPGRFVVPPTKAEEMYHPETFGRSGSDVVIVE